MGQIIIKHMCVCACVFALPVALGLKELVIGSSRSVLLLVMGTSPVFIGSYSYISMFLTLPSGWAACLTNVCCDVGTIARACVWACMRSLIKSTVVSKGWPFKSSGRTKHIFLQKSGMHKFMVYVHSLIIKPHILSFFDGIYMIYDCILSSLILWWCISLVLS